MISLGKWPRIAIYGLALVVLQFVVTVCLEIAIFVISQKTIISSLSTWSGDKSGVIYLILFMFGMIFSIYLYVDAVNNENTPQLITFVLLNVFSLAWGIIQYFQKKNSVWVIAYDGLFAMLEPYIISIPVILSVTTSILLYIVMQLYKIFGWEIYKLIGANLQLRVMYKQYQLFIQLLKVNFFLSFGFAAQFIVLVLHSKDVEFPITITMFPLNLVVLLLAFAALRRESKPLMWIFIVGMICFLGYYMFKLVRIYDPSQEGKYQNLALMLTFYCVTSLVVIVVSIFQAIVCLCNFGMGLEDKILSAKGDGDDLVYTQGYYINSAGERRMALEEYN